jgi:CRP/FNR family transcriptional regulator, cyclic AMP receptor protein
LSGAQTSYSRRVSSYFAYPTQETADAAADFAFLPRRPAQDWERIARHAERLRFRAGDLLVRKGDHDRSFYIVLSGRLEALPDGAAPAPIDTGSVFGEVAFLDNRPRSADVRAVEPGEALRLSYESFETLAARHAELGRAILLDLGKIVAARLRRADATG